MDTAVAIPDSISIPPGRYRWWVSATTPEGEATSQVRLIQIR
jgi:hypothetical protein